MVTHEFIVVSSYKRLAASTFHLRRLVRIDQRHRIVWVLEIGPQVIGRAARVSLDAWIFHDRLVEVDYHGIDQRQDPAVVLSRILAR